jgi:hypothetical protein
MKITMRGHFDLLTFIMAIGLILLTIPAMVIIAIWNLIVR